MEWEKKHAVKLNISTNSKITENEAYPNRVAINNSRLEKAVSVCCFAGMETINTPRKRVLISQCSLRTHRHHRLKVMCMQRSRAAPRIRESWALHLLTPQVTGHQSALLPPPLMFPVRGPVSLFLSCHPLVSVVVVFSTITSYIRIPRRGISA